MRTRSQARQKAVVGNAEGSSRMEMDPRALKRTQSLSSWSSEELSSEVDSCSTAFSESEQSDDVPCKRLRAGSRTNSDVLALNDQHQKSARSTACYVTELSKGMRETSVQATGGLTQPEPAARSLSSPASCSTSDVDHWFSREASHTPADVYARNPALSPAARVSLVEWICDVAFTYGMHLETLLLAINYMDRVLSARTIPRRQHHLLACACIWIAAKYEEVVPPSSEQVLELSKRAYTLKELIAMECTVMGCLNWNLSSPTSLKFMHTFFVEAKVTSRSVLMLAECLLQLACLDVPTCTHALPSHVAAAALCVSLAAYNSTETIPRVLEACRWNDTDTLAHMSQEVYGLFTRLMAQTGAKHPIIATYSARVHALVRSKQPDSGALAHLMVPHTPTPTPATPKQQQHTFTMAPQGTAAAAPVTPHAPIAGSYAAATAAPAPLRSVFSRGANAVQAACDTARTAAERVATAAAASLKAPVPAPAVAAAKPPLAPSALTTFFSGAFKPAPQAPNYTTDNTKSGSFAQAYTNNRSSTPLNQGPTTTSQLPGSRGSTNTHINPSPVGPVLRSSDSYDGSKVSGGNGWLPYNLLARSNSLSL